jgi:DNA polymerase (family 10)
MTLTLDNARQLAERIVAALAPFCERIDIAGSIRRARPVCGDIDIVCLPRPGRAADLESRCTQRGRIVKRGTQYMLVELRGGIQLDLWFSHAATGDFFRAEPCNHGMLLLARTGSAAHNIHLAARAKKMGLHFHPHRGILRGAGEGAQVVASETEEGVFRALGLDFIAPERRER